VPDFIIDHVWQKEYDMADNQQTQDPHTKASAEQAQQQQAQQQHQGTPEDFDALKDKKPEELTPEELRLMADTMPGEGPGD
jgi:hypothetical protein